MRYRSVASGLLTFALAGCTSTHTATANSESATAAVVQPGALTGIGATRADWDASHKRVPQYADDPFVYGPDPTLSTGYQYADVERTDDGHIKSYLLILHPGSQQQALARVAQELPPDAHADHSRDADLEGCTRFEYISAEAAAVVPGAITVQLQDVLPDGTTATGSNTYNQAQLDLGGDPITDDLGC